MSQSGYTPIITYNSSTTGHVPTTGGGSITTGELAVNITDGILFVGTGTNTYTTLAAKSGTTSITTLGTVTTGTWNATTIATGYGGTGLTSFTSGGAVYATSSSSLTTGILPVASGGTGSTSTQFVNLTTNVTGILPIANGGTNSNATATAGGVGYGTGTAHAYTSAGTSGQYLKSSGSGAPVWGCVSATPPTCYGAVGTYVTAFSGAYINTSYHAPGVTSAGACLYQAKTSSLWMGLNAYLNSTYANAIQGNGGSCGCFNNLGLSGTWRAMTGFKSNNSSLTALALWVRVS
jgi:hypothetical protein